MAILKIEELGARGSFAQLAIEGEIDLDTGGILRARLDELQRRGVDRLVLDMGETRYVNSSALAVLVKFAETFRERGDGPGAVDLLRQAREAFEEYTRLSAAGPKVHDARGLVERLSQQLSDLAATAVEDETAT